MSEMLTAKEMQGLLQVDRSTIYRMAEAGRLPAMKIGKQWRFPADQVDQWFQAKSNTAVSPSTNKPTNKPTNKLTDYTPDLAQLIPVECVQLILDSYADILGVMLIVTDMEGNPITEISNPCGLFQAISHEPDAVQKCIQSWHHLASALDFTPKLTPSHLGLLCTRAFIRVGTELKGMVIAGCIAPEQWPPTAVQVEQMAQDFAVPSPTLTTNLENIHCLDAGQQAQVLTFLPRIANIVAHIVNERKELVGRLDAIASLTQLS